MGADKLLTVILSFNISWSKAATKIWLPPSENSENFAYVGFIKSSRYGLEVQNKCKYIFALKFLCAQMTVWAFLNNFWRKDNSKTKFDILKHLILICISWKFQCDTISGLKVISLYIIYDNPKMANFAQPLIF